MASFSDFVGKEITHVLINDSQDVMLWEIGGAWYRIEAEGDCCSQSWYEHCDDPLALEDSILNSFEDVSMDSFEEGYEYIRVNMFKFKTSKGYCTIEFRNSSNGYYSGWASFRCLGTVLNDSILDFHRMIAF